MAVTTIMSNTIHDMLSDNTPFSRLKWRLISKISYGWKMQLSNVFKNKFSFLNLRKNIADFQVTPFPCVW